MRILLFAAAQVVAATAQSQRLSEYRIELASDATTEEHAAAKIVQTWASAVAGSALKIVTVGPNEMPAGGGAAESRNGVSETQAAITVGYHATLRRNASAEPELKKLGLEGWLITGSSGGQDGHWAISGAKGAPRGAIYGAHAFVETMLGVRFLAPNVTLSPQNGTDPKLGENSAM